MKPRKKTNWRPQLETLEARQLLSNYADFTGGTLDILASGNVSPNNPGNTNKQKNKDTNNTKKKIPKPSPFSVKAPNNYPIKTNNNKNDKTIIKPPHKK